ncbi:MAG: translocation/assembly module TamB domain-containing protein, partial [Candidatus Caldatribacteriaceae bacterium]
LSWHEDRIALSTLNVQAGELAFAGEISVGIEEQLPLTLQGVVRGARGQGFSLHIQGERALSLWDWVGEVRIQSLDETMHARGRFSLKAKEQTFSLNLDSASLPGVLGRGKVHGIFAGQGVNLVLQGFQIELPGGGSFPQGRGILDGEFRWGPRGCGGKLLFAGDALIFDRLAIESPRVEVAVAPGKLLLAGKGNLFGGNIDVRGLFHRGRVFLEGQVEGMALERFSSWPLAGSASGTLQVEVQEGVGKMQLVLTGGRLWWKNRELGAIAGGSLTYGDGKFLGKAIVVKKGNGYLKGDLEIEDENITGELEAFDYPFFYHWGGRELFCSLQGKGQIAGTGKQWALDLALSSSWTMGQQSGTFNLRGTLKDKLLTVDEFSCDWGDGGVSLAGDVEMYQRVNLQGKLSRLVLPSNQFGWSGRLDSLRFTLRGPWQSADFALEAEGGEFALQGRPLGEGLSLRMEGTLPLPADSAEHVSLAQYFDPRSFRRGEIVLRKVNLSSLGIDFLRRYHGEGVLDLVFRLDPEAGQWNFFSDNLSLRFPDYVDFRGTISGTYDGEELKISRLSLVDQAKRVSLKGWGKLGVKEKELDFRLEGEMDTTFPWKDGQWLFSGKGQGSMTITGTPEDPSLNGDIVLSRGEVYRRDEQYASFSEVKAKFTGESLRILSGKGQVGGMAVEVEGELSSRGVNLHCRVDGANIFPGFTEVLKGTWRGNLSLSGAWDDLKLKGELSLQDGLLDLRETKGFTSQHFVAVLENWGNTVPLTVELILSTANILEVKTRFIDLWLGGKVNVTGKGNDLLVEGRLEVQKGTYDLVFVKFPLRGYVFFNHLVALEPQLALEGEKEVGKHRIRLTATGGLSDYTISLSSEPPLSPEEILSLLFLGREDAYLALETVNIAPLLLKGLQFLLRGNDGFLSRIPFFDEIELDLAHFSRLKLEKRLGKNVSLGYTQELSGERKSSWDVEVDFGREWSFRGAMDSRGVTEWWLEFRTRF